MINMSSSQKRHMCKQRDVFAVPEPALIAVIPYHIVSDWQQHRRLPSRFKLAVEI